MSGDLNDLARARVGTALSKKYRLERLIGTGGMAAVYQAVHRNGLHVAIKMLHPHLSIDADLRARFLREGYAANKVKHRGAVRVLDDDRAADGSVFLVMELLEGETLDALLQRNDSRLPLREVSQLAAQLLETLAVAHDQKIVHRDIKPENLFLTSEGVLKVLDFGIARLREANAPEAATRTGRMIGTPAFMPPEQALGRSRQIDGQTDLWAVGATMFTLASGQFVHEAETMEEMLVCAGSRHARPLVQALPSAPPALATVIDRALVFDKAQRWPDALTMRAALARAYQTVYGTGLRVHSVEPAGLPDPGGPTVDDPALQRRALATPEETVGTGTEMSAAAAPLMLTPSVPLRPAAKRLSTTAGLESGARSVSANGGVTRGTRKAALGVALLAVLLLFGVGGAIVFRALRSGATPQSGATAAASERSLGETSARVAPMSAPTPESTAPPSRAENPPTDSAARALAPGSKDGTAMPTAVRRRSGAVAPSPGPSAVAVVTTIPEPTPIVPSVASAPPVLGPGPQPPAHESAPAPAATPSCRIVTSYDADGHPHFKKVCN